MKSLNEALQRFLQDIDKSQWPQIGVIGVAGPVNENCCDQVTNAKHWPAIVGEQVKQDLNLEKFQILNDFEAAGYGVLNLENEEVINLNKQDTTEEESGVKAVIGPGTGLGQCFLTKSKHAPYHEVYAAEGGHCEFSPRSNEDFELLTFAKEYIENNLNIENLRAKGKIDRVSVERIVAGPAVPLLYAFLKKKYANLESNLEKDIKFEEITSYNIIDAAINQNDELCLKVVDKFIELLAVECGNLALKTLPYGGLYLIGGVTAGISQRLANTDTFITNFYMKGRLEPKVRKVPIYVVKDDSKVGILGAEEFCFRLLTSQNQ